ncbi:hypothetical protein L207DRAFT_612487 [Hyaloscypha variabilis F]|uniref:Uncharacterized protein n=1 Tax=Hyaloscypha variabilis (strain UAMH 11265 / GT02V1 / F) TaxID=1149755 RepID=A0A2J6S5L3_HYAVF|nr:hypothetical protein L207DRAFT_612487 [Hyaloscypha variabilis F]
MSSTTSLVRPAPKYTGPETAMVTFRWEFSMMPRLEVEETFTLDHHPSLWKNLSKVEGADSIRECVRKIGAEYNGASKLILVIMLANVSSLKGSAGSFWGEVKKEAWSQLTKFYGQPEQYLGLVENVVCKQKGFLTGLVSAEGKKYFKISKTGEFTWITDMVGQQMAENLIGELSSQELKLI